MKKMMKILALILCVSIVLSALSIVATATEIVLPQDSAQTKPDTNEAEETEDVIPLFEVTDKRDANTKHFRMSDGTFKSATYPFDVHYKNENGEYEDINNS